MYCRSLILLIFFTLTLAQSNASQMENTVCENYNYENVSIMNLIVTPEKYGGKIVQIAGVLSLAFESRGLYFSKESFEYNLPNLLVNIEFPEDIISKHQNLNGKYVILEGLFESSSEFKGVRGAYLINKVCHIQSYPKLGTKPMRPMGSE